MTGASDSNARPLRRNLRAAVAGAFAGIGLVGAALMLVMVFEHDAGEGVYQGLMTEARNALVGGRYRIALVCATPDNRVSYYTRARDSRTAHEALRWTLPVCELTSMSSQAPPGRDSSGFVTDWYRGDFRCPANFHRRSISLSARNLSDAIAEASAGLRDCRMEYADQTHCPLLRPGCQRVGEDFREPAHMIARRSTR